MVVRFPVADDLDGALAHPPWVVDTAVGPVEYAEAGEGPVLLSVHGSGGGWDYGLGMSAVFWLNGFRVIAPSRPGYLGTPLETGRTYEQQADALVALLDVLGVERAAALGFSGGGPPTFLLAARHPDRVSCLVEVGSLSTTYGVDSNPVLMKVLFSRAGMELLGAVLRVLVARFPEVGAQLLMGDETTQDRRAVADLARRITADPPRAAFVSRVWAGSARRVGERLPGQQNDNAQILALTDLPIAGLLCPTLIVQGTADTLPARHAEYAAAAIPGAEVHWIEDGAHRGLWVSDDAGEHQQYVLSWLRDRTTN